MIQENKYCDITDIVTRLDKAYIEIGNEKKESKFAHKGLHQIMINFLVEIPKYGKCVKILEKNNCDFCKYHKEKTTKYYCSFKKEFEPITYYEMDEDNEICLSCERRCDIIQGIMDNIKKNVESLITDDVIKIRTILNKINSKLTNLKKEAL